ncbi:hypothetical protein [Saccharothrix yanglingensis]|uniref:Uncharacterized protein n=1 Tax=Saccharothrix yanglingensis TaxID=659496 RepID=A0ABU0X395_9PSEU|nr:hypothetical protein [Saccharothrix yanglingensis]MDQ2586605.1 hypothetical protein [Saccharothrix yanglingensis]
MAHHHSFPGPRVGATAMVLGPLLLLTATALRLPFHHFFPQQLTAVAEHPALMATAHTAALAGTVLLVPAVLVLAHDIGRLRPVWATWAAGLVLVGVTERIFHAGVDQAAHGLVRRHGAEFATDLVARSYGDLHLFSFLSFTILLGWPVLAFAAHRTGALGSGRFAVVRAVALGATSLLPLGVLKGTEVTSVVAVVGLCVALVPGGVRLARGTPRPTHRSVLVLLAAVPVLGVLGVVSTLG